MNLVEILNTIRDNASATYQERIPEATQNNLETIQAAMVDGDNIMVANEFMGSLLNKIVKSYVHNKLFENPLKRLKKGTKPLGDGVEEIYNNFLKGAEYDPTGAKLMARNLPDTKAVYHRMNRKSQYTVTVSREALVKAFSSWENLESYIRNIMQALYNSASLDEFTLTKQLMVTALENAAMKFVEIPDPLASEANGKECIKAVKTISGLMRFPSSEYNAYLDAQDQDDVPIITFSEKNEQVLILPTAEDTSLAVDVLASTFNMSVADFNDTQKIVVDLFPNVTVGDKTYKVHGFLADEAFFQIFDDLFGITTFENGQGLYTNYYLNVWQTLAYSILVNCVAFVSVVA